MKLSLQPILRMLDSRVRRRAPRGLGEVAARRWVVAGPHETRVPAAYFLDGQLERIRGWAFMDEHPGRDMTGGDVTTHGPTTAFLLRDAVVLDGVIYCANACEHLRARSHRLPRLYASETLDRGAVACTPGGNRWFGTWVMDDCTLHQLARDEGRPVTTNPPMSAQARAYADLFDVHPRLVDGAHFRELVVFEDLGQNPHKAARFETMRRAVRSRYEASPHPGVFLRRGGAGARRVLRNEDEIAEHLRRHRGFRIVDPMSASVDEVLRDCVGARVVAGIEGSGLIHGVLGQTAGDAILTLQPPDRFVSVYKHLADRDGQSFAFVVGRTVGDGDFHVELDEVDRTLDLLPRGG